MKKTLAVFILGLVFTLFSISEKTEAINRKGFLIGFDLGPAFLHHNSIFGNSVHVQRNLVGAQFSLYLGGSFDSRWAMMGMITGAGGEAKDASGAHRDLSYGFVGPVGQYTFERAYLRFGAGFSNVEYEKDAIVVGGTTYRADSTKGGVAAYFSPGFEVYQSENGGFAMDLNAKFIPMGTEDGFAMISSFGLGFTWY